VVLKPHKVYEVEVGNYSAIVEDGEIRQTLPAPGKTSAQIKSYIFLEEVLEAKGKTKLG